MVEVKWNICFSNTFYLLCLTATTFMKWFEVLKNNAIIFGWQLFAYFHQISNIYFDKYKWRFTKIQSEKEFKSSTEGALKPTLNEQNNFGILNLNRNGVS